MDQADIDRVVGMVRRRLPSQFDHEDIAIDILIESWQNQIERPSESFVRQRCINAYRRSKGEELAMVARSRIEDPNDRNEIEREDRVLDVDKLMKLPTPRQRKIIWYRFYKGVSITETARAMKLEPSLVRTELIEAIELMRERALGE